MPIMSTIPTISRRSLTSVVALVGLAASSFGCACAAPTPTGPPAAFKLFNQLRTDHCTSLGELSDAVQATRGPSANEVTMKLRSGDLLILNTKKKVVYPVGGPTKVLKPYSYSFNCDPDIFQGTLDH
ncbi:MAG TPA: hypothetical protein DEG13_00315 [Candidatus Microthrix parvicella]|jgi:hypothetical protein|nr:hypothetical protein [Candidatus Microthrix parvicella]